MDRELLPLAQKALQDNQINLKIILIDDDSAEVKPSVELEVLEYEELINSGDSQFTCQPLLTNGRHFH